MMKKRSRTAFIHGRPAPHPAHTRIAKAVEADLIPVDRLLKYHEQQKSPRLKRYLSWIINALFFPGKRKYHLIMSEGLHFVPILLKLLHLIPRRTKIVALLANEVLWFTKSHRYSPVTTKLNIFALNHYDHLVCIGEWQTSLARQLAPKHQEKIITIQNGVPAEKVEALKSVNPNLQSKNLLFIGNVQGSWRLFYKGMDVMTKAFVTALEKDNTLTFTIIGEWDKENIDYIKNLIPVSFRNHIKFEGKVQNIEKHFSSCGLYFHCANGDSYPTTVLEAMAAGVPALISHYTGTIELVRQVTEELIVPYNEKDIAERISWWFSQPADFRKNVSEKCREIAASSREDELLEGWKRKFSTISGE